MVKQHKDAFLNTLSGTLYIFRIAHACHTPLIKSLNLILNQKSSLHDGTAYHSIMYTYQREQTQCAANIITFYISKNDITSQFISVYDGSNFWTFIDFEIQSKI